MYPRDAVRRLVEMVRSGQISLEGYVVTEFALDRVNEAVAHATANAGPFNMTVVTP
jgi:alcohol dehydrogenase